MRTFWIITFFSLVSANLFDLFENWAHKFSIQFRDKAHLHEVFRTWSENHRFIEEINAKNLSFKLGHNPFSGMDSEQFRVFMGFDKPSVPTYDYLTQGYNEGVFESYKSDFNSIYVPENVDWSLKGGVTPVKDQGQCGSCWSFSATGALEGAYFTKYGVLDSFSEQQLVDCDTRLNGGKDMGCKGGLMDNAFAWITKNGGLCTEQDYPYVSGTTKTAGQCVTICSVVSKSIVKEFVDVPPSSENAMMSSVAKQPVSIAIQADQREFQLYKSGVFTGACGTKLDHGVLLVGYGFFDGLEYWKVKNSWSTAWGDDGYILLAKGAEYNNGDGQCGLLLQGSYPVLL
jgi:C1A family cysteine protease